MNRLIDTYTLSNGVRIPCVGFGTWQIPDGKATVDATAAALEAGYRHIDTAAMYGNEQSVGQAIRESGIEREQVFVTSKLQNDMHGYENTKAAFAGSLHALGMDYIDLYLIHWPNPIHFRDRWKEANAGTWKALEELLKEGRVRSIGISNFHRRHIEALMETAKVAPMVNQLRLCPGDVDKDLVQYSRELGMLPEAYSPLGTGKLLSIPEVTAIARHHGRTAAQVLLRWSLNMGFLPLPKSTTVSRIQENTQVFDFELSQEDMSVLSALEGIVGYAHDPDTTNF